MGDPGSKARTLAMDFYALDDDVWRKHKELAQILGKAPHYTDARVGRARQRSGIGTDGAWFVQCQVPPAMLRALANAVSGGSIGSINVRMALRGIYSSGVGVSQAVSSGWFLRPNWRDNTVQAPETAYGVSPCSISRRRKGRVIRGSLSAASIRRHNACAHGDITGGHAMRAVYAFGKAAPRIDVNRDAES